MEFLKFVHCEIVNNKLLQTVLSKFCRLKSGGRLKKSVYFL